jgi:hypothetical protein
VNKTIRDVAIGAGLIGLGYGTRPFLEKQSEELEEKAVKATGRAVDPEKRTFTEEGSSIIADHEKKIGIPFKRENKLIMEDFHSGMSDPRDDSITIGERASNFTLAHELGHRQSDHSSNPIASTTKYTYGKNPIPSLIRGPALIAAGYFAPTTRRALAYGATAQFLSHAGTLTSEHLANRNAMNLLEERGQPVDKSIPREQLTGYVKGIAADAAIPVGIGIAARSLTQNPHIRDFLKRKVQNLRGIKNP